MTGMQTSNDKITRMDWIAAAILFAVALAIRLIKLNALDVWFDEVVLLFQIKMSFGEIWTFCQNENFPPLFPWLLKTWNGFFPGESSLRLFCALLGALTPAAVYFLGREVQDRRLGWILGALCVLSVTLVYYSQMIRMYTILPALACLSVTGFLRGVKTDRLGVWIFTAVVNLVGFYIFLFFLLLVFAESLALIWFRRKNLKLLFRPLIAHLPTMIVMLLWVGVMLQRYTDVKIFFLELELSKEFFKTWVFFGTAKMDFGNSYLAVAILNIPLLLGFIAAVIFAPRKMQHLALLILFAVPILIALAISLAGQSIFFGRYFIFLLPLYLCLAVGGWLSLPRRSVQVAGVVAIFITMTWTLGYYFTHYLEAHHKEYNFAVPHEVNQPGDGHALSHANDYLQQHIAGDEVVIHCSNPVDRVFSFFPSIYYNQRSLREYLYSADRIPNYFGNQYMLPGDQIRSFQEIAPSTTGVWLVTFDPPQLLTDPAYRLAYQGRNLWLNQENLPQQLTEAGFTPQNTLTWGRVTVIHYRVTQSQADPAE
jgi:4-amino-4-deoxy-L-arabinose transferase-like glycosyltransferase